MMCMNSSRLCRPCTRHQIRHRPNDIYRVGQIKRGYSFQYLVTLDILIRSKQLLASSNIISFLIRIYHF